MTPCGEERRALLGYASGSVVDNDREESKAARDRPLPEHFGCPPRCRCRECVADEIGPEDMR